MHSVDGSKQVWKTDFLEIKLTTTSFMRDEI